MKLTARQLKVLGHVVIDPQEWADHAEATVGVHAVLLKIDKYTPAYEQALERFAGDYKTRAVRQEEEDAAIQTHIAERLQLRLDAQTASEEARKKEITDIVEAVLAAKNIRG